MRRDFIFSGNNGQSILIKNGDKTDDYYKTECPMIMHQINQFRGGILSIAVSIENLIGSLIEFIIFDEKNESTEFFSKLFLNTNYITFYNKFKIFKYLCKEHKKVKNHFNKDIITQIQKCIEVRNVAAHSTIYIDGETKKIYIEFMEENVSTIVERTEDFCKQKVELLYSCINLINKLIYGDGFDAQRIKM